MVVEDISFRVVISMDTREVRRSFSSHVSKAADT